MKFGKSVKQLAQQIVDAGFVEFVGESLVVEIATKIIDGKTCGHKQWKIVKPIEKNDRKNDYAIVREGKAGSNERIAAYATIVAQQGELFTLTDDDLASHLAALMVRYKIENSEYSDDSGS